MRCVAVLVKIWKYSTTRTCYNLTGVASIIIFSTDELYKRSGCHDISKYLIFSIARMAFLPFLCTEQYETDLPFVRFAIYC